MLGKRKLIPFSHLIDVDKLTHPPFEIFEQKLLGTCIVSLGVSSNFRNQQMFRCVCYATE